MKAGNSSVNPKPNEISSIQSPLLPITAQDDDTDVPEEFLEYTTGGSFSGAVFNLSTSIVGAGIMALPATMKVLGLVPGILLILFVACLTEASLELLVRFTSASKMNTYGRVMRDAFARPGRILLQLCIIINNAGMMVVYMIIIGDVLSGTSSSGTHHTGLLEGWFGDHWWSARTFVLLITTIFVFTPLTCLKHIDSLRYTSALSVGLAIVFVIVTSGIAIFKLCTGTIEMPRLFPNITDLASVWHLFTSVPVIVTAYICHYNLHSIINELENSSKIQPIIRTSLGLCSIVYILTSVFAYLLFGEETQDDVLTNFDSDLGVPFSTLLNDIVRVSYVLHIMLVFPLVFFAVRVNLDGLCFPSRRHAPLADDNRRFYFFTVVMLVLVYFIAIFVPSIWDAFQITGATAAVCIAFIFPASIVLKDPHGIASKKDKILSIFMIVLAVLANAVALYSDAYAIFRKKKEA
ncbi:putative sodium-coupled neutral amino acid transporter 6 [Carex littledalei]|uniref:Putative sodium-coupled neutral amino acid transporter 6 n=1 Tax=Carex littledalei TaxID=544730 RepID=A0A833VNQ0_9POAL|nr:putative sodium-coupled neutral amino acid transporter 6 [Carex littledalei]